MVRNRATSVFAVARPIIDDDEDEESESSSDDGEDEELDEHTSIAGLTWTTEETQNLIAQIEAILPKNDRYSYYRRLKLLQWTKINVPGHTTDDCKEQIANVFKKLRHIRNLSEILNDAKLELERKPQWEKPKSSYTLFCKDLIANKSVELKGKNFFQTAAEKFRGLSAKERSKYDTESNKQRATYGEAKQKFEAEKISDSKPTPLNLFCYHHFKLGNTNKLKLRSMYSKLPEEEKLKWIEKSINKISSAYPNADLSQYLRKTELKLHKGLPKAPLNAYNLFVRDFCADKQNDFKKASEFYRVLDAEKRNEYVKKAEELKGLYQTEIETYKQTLSSSELEIFENSKKKKKPVSDVVVGTTEHKIEAILSSVNSSEPVQSSTPINIKKTKPVKEKNNKQAIPTETDKNVTSTSTTNPSKRSNPSSTLVTPTIAKKLKVERIDEPEKVPSSPFRYFVEREYKGKQKKAKKAFATLPDTERKRIKKAAKQAMKTYMEQLEKYLQSLTKEEMIEYADRTRQLADESDDSFSDTSSSDDDN